MTRPSPILLSMLAAGTAWSVAPSRTLAQCRLCESPTIATPSGQSGGEVDLQVEAALDFDRLILLGSGDGTAQLRPDGSTQVTGVIGAVSARAMVGSATVRGEAGRALRIELPRQIDLYSHSGGRVSLDEIVSDLSDTPKLDPTGTLTFRFGGRVRISGDAEGDYRGDMPITAQYL